MAIDWTKVSSELRAQIEARLPAGLTLDNVRRADAQLVSIERQADPENESALRQAAIEKAGGPPMITQGKPTILRVVAWMAHEGINKNRLAFTREDLTQAAAKIKEPDFLPMDFNHSAVDGGLWSQKAIGVWYRAEMAQDPGANGTWGILATGMMWSWLNPDLADTLLAEQARNGRMDFSMACIAGSVTQKHDENGPYEVAQDTTFFTLSALDVPPADPNATGKGVEGSSDPGLEDQLRQELKEAGAVPPPAPADDPVGIAVLALAADGLTPPGAPKPALPAPNGGKMDELIAQLTKLSLKASEIADANLKESITAAIDAKVSELLSKIEAKASEKSTRETDLESQLAAAQQQVAELEQKVTDAVAAVSAAKSVDATVIDLEAKLADANTAKDAAALSIDTANKEIERLTAELTAAQEKLATFEQAEADKTKQARLTSRFAELPENYRKAFANRPAEEQDKAKARWSDMTDEQWGEFKADVEIIPLTRTTYLARSEKEGVIPTGGNPAGGGKDRLAQFLSR